MATKNEMRELRRLFAKQEREDAMAEKKEEARRREAEIKRVMKAGFTRKQAVFLLNNFALEDHEHRQWRA